MLAKRKKAAPFRERPFKNGSHSEVRYRMNSISW